MPVALMLPTSSSGGDWHGQFPLTTARRYVRGKGCGRWHRVRAAVVYPAGTHGWMGHNWLAVEYWCGPHVVDLPKRPLLWTDELSDGEPVCGTCVGRALGAGQDQVPTDLPPMVFDPRWQTPPRWCPGSGRSSLWRRIGRADVAGMCLVCGEAVPIRARPFPGWGYGMQRHLTGPDVVEPCPFHAWKRLVEQDGRVRCGCGWPYELKLGWARRGSRPG